MLLVLVGMPPAATEVFILAATYTSCEGCFHSASLALLRGILAEFSVQLHRGAIFKGCMACGEGVATGTAHLIPRRVPKHITAFAADQT